MNLFDFDFLNTDGSKFDKSILEGKKVLIFNSASACGFTSQLGQLEELYKEYNDKGLVVLSFPCNDFGGQEPGTNEEIRNFCQLNYGVTFPILQKINILSTPKSNLFEWLQKESGIEIKWNFYKFCIDENGALIKGFSSSVDPVSEEIINWIENK